MRPNVLLTCVAIILLFVAVFIVQGDVRMRTKQYDITSEHDGKTFTYEPTDRFTVYIETGAPPLGVSCDRIGVLGTVSNIPDPPDGFEGRRYEAVQPGRCTLSSGTFDIAVRVRD